MLRHQKKSSIRGIHFYANSNINSGDFFIGPATKWETRNKLGINIEWKSFNVAKKINKDTIQRINQNYDVMVLGGGGLLLPDTNSNMISCWQWPVSSNMISEINIPIYVIGLGYNLFYGQKVTMMKRNSDKESQNREKIFRDNLQTLVNHSHYFSMRHKGDIECLINIIGEEYRDNIKFEFCPVVNYVKSHYANTVSGTGKCHTFEIKDDRPNRRYIGTSKEKFYNVLKDYIEFLLDKNEEIAIMSHDGSKSFYQFLLNHNIRVPLLRNSCKNENRIIGNYRKVKKLYCTAGHSQMTAHALGINYFSLISHDKLEYFLKDVGMFNDEKYSYVNNPNLLNDLKRT